MSESVKIANLQIEVSDNSATAVTSLSKFIETLQAVKSATGDNLGLKNVATGLKQVGDAVRDNNVFETLAESMAKATGYAERLASALSSIATTYKSIGNGKGFQSMAKTAQKMQEQANSALTSSGRSAVSQGEVDSNASGITRLKEESDRPRDSLISAFDYLKNVQMNDHVSAELKAMADEAYHASRPFDKLQTAIFKIGGAISSLKGMASQVIGSIIPRGLAQITSQLGRMLRMKTLRLIVGSLIQGFKQGLQNVYYWAKATGDQFAVSMDTISTSMNYAKNSIGAAFSSILNLVAPHIDKLIDILVTGINYINMFFAALGGQSTYTKAKKVATEFGTAATGALGGAAGAARELKEELSVLDFDELNQLQAQPTSSGGSGGGGGGGTPATDYAGMFEKANIEDNFLTRTAGWLADNFKDILDYVKAIGAGILAWKISNALADNLGIFKSLKQKIGITLMVAGFTLEYEGAYGLGYNGFNLADMIKTAIGSALGIAGSLLVFGTGPLGWTVGIGLAITTFVVGFSMGRWQAVRDELEATSQSYQAATRGIEDATNRINIANNTLSSIRVQSIMDNAEYKKWTVAAELLEKIRSFEGIKADPATLGELQLYVDQLNDILESAGLSDYLQFWVDASGAIQTNADNIQTVIDKMLEMARVDALKDLFAQNVVAMTEAEIDNATRQRQNEGYQNTINTNQETIDRYLSDLEAKSNEALGLGGGTLYGITWDEYAKAVLEVEHSTEALEKNNEAIALNNEIIAEGKIKNDLYTESLFGVAEAAEEVSKNMPSKLPEVPQWKQDLGVMPQNYFQPVAEIPQPSTGQQWYAGMSMPTIQQPTLPKSSIVPNTIVTTTAYKADTRGLDNATYSTYQYSGAVQSVYTAEDRARAYQIAYDQGFTDIADSIRRGGEEAQKYTGYILNTNTQMQNSSKYTNDATASYSSQIPVVKSLGTTSVATAGNVGLINGAMNNIGKGISYNAIIAGFSAGLSKDKIGNIGLNNIKNPIESQANLTGSGFNGNNVFSRISGAINYSAYKTPGTNIKNNIESPIQNTGQGLKANQILNYISGQFNAQKWSGIGNNMVKDIVNGFNAINSQMTNSIRALCNGMQSAASSAPWSNIGRTIGQDIKYGLQQIISSFNFNVAVSANGKSYTVNGTARAYFASGGFPEEGTVFVAGEAGAEAVGTINGRTGVANRDQIASAIAMALKPMLDNGGGGTETIYVNTYLDSQVVARANAKGQKAMNRRYNITAKA